MRAGFKSSRAVALAALALALATTLWAQSTPQAGSQPAPASAPTAQPAPGTTPVGGDTPPAAPGKPPAAGATPSRNSAAGAAQAGAPAAQPAPGTTPVGGDTPPAAPGKQPAPGTTPVGGDVPATTSVNPDKVIEPGSQKVSVKAGSIDDVNAVGNRDIGGRGIGNWYSTDYEIKVGKGFAMEIEKSTKFITDPVVLEYVNRVGQNIVKNSDCKVPFTIKIIDSDVINAMALPGGFFYVNSGLILNADEEAELAGVMAHETAHVCAHHVAREMTRSYYAQIGMVPLIFIGGWTGYGIYEAASIGIPMTFLQFSRDFEAQ
ncbi:MAG: M48 family metalloprotease, partial [Terracidiphilus sp.]